MLYLSGCTTLRWASAGIKSRVAGWRCRSFFSTTRLNEEETSHEQDGFYNTRLSRLWTPTGGFQASSSGKTDDATALLLKAGFIRQAHSGIFHYLPLADMLRDRLDMRIAYHLEQYLDAARVSLSSLSSESLWRQSGRIGEKPLSEVEHQFLTIKDRKDSKLILAPTHEEEITSLVAADAKSYKDFPLRLFQIGAKYRDELRPRHGLLRTKEFIMKDMYTFDVSEEAAIKTYNEVRKVYRLLFKRLGLPVVEARASSGDMGGDLSHEFHVLSESGEDTLHICRSCGFAENEEVTSKPIGTAIEDHTCPQCSNKSMSRHNAIEIGHTFHLGTRYSKPLNATVEVPVKSSSAVSLHPSKDSPVDLPAPGPQRVPLQMGCHGIGLSRLMGATAALFKDDKGLRWPLTFAPVQAVIICDGNGDTLPAMASILNTLREIYRGSARKIFRFQPMIDDRPKSLAWKLKDAELIGYPITIILGRKYLDEGLYELKCRFDHSLSQESPYLVSSLLSILNRLDPETTPDTKMWFSSKTAWRKEQLAALQHPVRHDDMVKKILSDASRAHSSLQYEIMRPLRQLAAIDSSFKVPALPTRIANDGGSTRGSRRQNDNGTTRIREGQSTSAEMAMPLSDSMSSDTNGATQPRLRGIESRKGTMPPARTFERSLFNSANNEGERSRDSWLPSSAVATGQRSAAEKTESYKPRRNQEYRQRRQERKSFAPESKALSSVMKASDKQSGGNAQTMHMDSGSSGPPSGTVGLSRAHLLEKVQLLERLFALQDKEKAMEAGENNR